MRFRRKPKIIPYEFGPVVFPPVEREPIREMNFRFTVTPKRRWTRRIRKLRGIR